MEWWYGSMLEGCIVLTAVGFLTFVIWSKVLSYNIKLENKKKIKQKQEELKARKKALEESLTVNGELLESSKKKILGLRVKELSERLRSGALSPTEVLQAFQSKALAVDKETNSVCDFILEALDIAKHLETIPENQRGPLFGIPISVKECFLVKGYDSTVGLASLLFSPSEQDCEFVKHLKDLHAIPFCITNVSQLCFTINTSNPIYGQTHNPHNLALSPGGSSGGEGALIGGGGSILGIGTDIGGSLRIPAHVNGICSLRPTNGRLYMSGMRTSVGVGNKAVMNGIYSVNGFLSSCTDGLELAMRAMLSKSENMAQEDWRVVPLGWREDLFARQKKLRVGWYDYDGIFPAASACKRAVHEVVKLLEDDGHEVVQWTPPMLPEMLDTFNKIIFADGGRHTLDILTNEILDDSIKELTYKYRCPSWLKTFLRPIIGMFSKTLAFFFTAGPFSGSEAWTHNATMDTLIYQFTRLWQDAGLDVLICPGMVYPAFPPEHGHWLSGSALPGISYTAVYNLVRCPVGAVTVTRQGEEDEDMTEELMRKDYMNRMVGKVARWADGCPVGVQVVGRHFQEETVLYAMKLIEQLKEASV
eukprot:GFUD01022493.1.p1 GENE.GFUD01022493.1~~GFUD01022493.1.p1  ORF type:complete len:590 (-),score=122.08 GFUD01022493.1:119-1888(-)